MVKYTDKSSAVIRRMFSRFQTVHGVGSHKAIATDGSEIVPSQPTEIDLVRALANLGIDLQHYNGNGTGSGFNTAIDWYRIK